MTAKLFANSCVVEALLMVGKYLASFQLTEVMSSRHVKITVQIRRTTALFIRRERLWLLISDHVDAVGDRGTLVTHP